MAERKKGSKPRTGGSRAQTPDPHVRAPRPEMGRATIPPALNDPDQREGWGLPRDVNVPGDYMVELNLLYRDGLEAARKSFLELYHGVLGKAAKTSPPVAISKSYYRCKMSVKQWQALVKKDEEKDRHLRCVYKVWPDFRVRPLMDRSVATVKADAAVKSYEATGEGICWAVIDSRDRFQA